VCTFLVPLGPPADTFPGYSRIVLALASLYYMPLHPRTCSLLYSISCLLDALDGYAARRFQQSTKFGAVLDMVTDRCTTSCLLVFLAQAFPRWSIVFQGLISLDLASHYMHMYATLSMGGSEQSHKNVDESRSWILNQYYSNNVRFKNLDPPLCADNSTESPLPVLRHERDILHCPLPPLLLFAAPLAHSAWRQANANFDPAWLASCSKALDVLHKPLVSRCHGDGPRK
jgi:hypothetical protein